MSQLGIAQNRKPGLSTASRKSGFTMCLSVTVLTSFPTSPHSGQLLAVPIGVTFELLVQQFDIDWRYRRSSLPAGLTALALMGNTCTLLNKLCWQIWRPCCVATQPGSRHPPVAPRPAEPDLPT